MRIVDDEVRGEMEITPRPLGGLGEIHRCGEKWPDTGYILEVELKICLWTGSEKEESELTPVLARVTRRMNLPFIEMGKAEH